MHFYEFKEIRTGKIRKIGGADNAVDAIDALTIYPWAFELLNPRNAEDRAAVEAWSKQAKATADAEAAAWKADFEAKLKQARGEA